MQSSLHTQQSLKDTNKVITDEQEKTLETSTKSENERRASAKGQGWGRIFTYYQPKVFAVIMLVTAGLNALSFPSLGFCVAEIQLILIE